MSDATPSRDDSGVAADSAWIRVGELDLLPRLGARVYPFEGGNLAIFRAADDTVFAVRDRCPHKGGPLSQGIVCGHAVTCPLHGWTIDLREGVARAPDIGAVERFSVRIEHGQVWLLAGRIRTG